MKIPSFDIGGEHVGHALMALALTAFKRLGIIASLCEREAWAEAAILARTMLDLLVTGSYLFYCSDSDRENRARRFWAFDAAQDARKFGRVQKIMALDPSALGSPAEDRLNQVEAHRAEALAAFADIEKRAGHGWSGLAVGEMIEKIENTSIQTNLKMLYTFSYFSLSDWVHPTPTGVVRALWSDDELRASEWLHPAIAAGGSAALLVHILAQFGNVAGPNTDESIGKIRTMLIDEFKNDDPRVVAAVVTWAQRFVDEQTAAMSVDERAGDIRSMR